MRVSTAPRPASVYRRAPRRRSEIHVDVEVDGRGDGELRRQESCGARHHRRTSRSASPAKKLSSASSPRAGCKWSRPTASSRDPNSRRRTRRRSGTTSTPWKASSRCGQWPRRRSAATSRACGWGRPTGACGRTTATGGAPCTFPAPLREDTVVVVETLVFSVPLNQLVWAGVSETKNPKQLQTFVKDLVGAAAKEMEKQGFIAERQVARRSVEILHEHDFVPGLVVEQLVDERSGHRQPEAAGPQPLLLADRRRAGSGCRRGCRSRRASDARCRSPRPGSAIR